MSNNIMRYKYTMISLDVLFTNLYMIFNATV